MRMGNFIAFVLGLFAGGIVCLLGVALVAADERYACYRKGYEAGYQDAIEKKGD